MSGPEHFADYDAEPSVGDDLVAYVRFHGANEVIDAVLAVAVEIYGDMETALPKVHETLLRRAVIASGKGVAP